MKWKGWGRRFEWERTKEISVFATDDKAHNQKQAVIKEVEKLLREFSIRLDVSDGNLKHGEDLRGIQALLSSSVKENKIDSDKFEEELDKARGKGQLLYGLIIVIDKDRYEFNPPRGQPNPAIFGIGVPDGLVILRYTHKNSVRHEFGHMVGLPHHRPPKPECIMNWECATASFCDECKRQIDEMWKPK